MFEILENTSPETGPVYVNLIRAILDRNGVLQEYMRERRWNAVEALQCRFTGSTDTGINLAVINTDGIWARSAEWELIHVSYRVTTVFQCRAVYDHLVYPLIFWNGKGGCRNYRR
jgi:DICT domain-containing protein